MTRINLNAVFDNEEEINKINEWKKIVFDKDRFGGMKKRLLKLITEDIEKLKIEG